MTAHGCGPNRPVRRRVGSRPVPRRLCAHSGLGTRSRRSTKAPPFGRPKMATGTSTKWLTFASAAGAPTFAGRRVVLVSHAHLDATKVYSGMRTIRAVTDSEAEHERRFRSKSDLTASMQPPLRHAAWQSGPAAPGQKRRWLRSPMADQIGSQYRRQRPVEREADVSTGSISFIIEGWKHDRTRACLLSCCSSELTALPPR